MGRARLNGQGGGGSNIKSIQKGFTSLTSGTTKNVTISAVDLNNSVVIISVASEGSFTANDCQLLAKFTSSTNVEITRYNTGNLLISWQVIEFKNVKSIQRGELTFTPSNYNTDNGVTINQIDLNKSILFFSHKSNMTFNNSGFNVAGRIKTATSLSFNAAFQSVTTVVGWQVIEFK